MTHRRNLTHTKREGARKRERKRVFQNARSEYSEYEDERTKDKSSPI